MGKVTYGDKSFLNNMGHHSVAAIGHVYEVYCNDNGYVGGDGTLWISDCSRVISLELEFDNEDAYQNTKFKLEQIKEAATIALVNLELARKTYLDMKQTKKEENKLTENKE